MTSETRPGLPPFNDAYRNVEITPEERFVGPRTLELFKREIIRPLPWSIKDGRIEVEGTPTPIEGIVLSTTFPGQSFSGDVRPHAIVTEGLERERITPELASVIAQFKMIEDYLPDFMGRATNLFRGNLGISASYNQWGREELQHSLAAGLILERTGHRTQEQLAEDQMAGLLKTWETPFPTARQVVLYAAFQELQTRDAYKALADRAMEEDAPITAGILRLISRDEAYHGGGYMKFARVYHEFDPEGTVADALHVAENFRMPALNLLPNQRVAFRNALEVGVYGGDMGQETMFRALRGLQFVPLDQARQAAEAYGAKQQRVRELSQRVMTSRPSGIVTPK
jgi:hypothetical protein